MKPNYQFCQSYKTTQVCQKISAFVCKEIFHIPLESELGCLLSHFVTSKDEKYLICGGAWWVTRKDEEFFISL